MRQQNNADNGDKAHSKAGAKGVRAPEQTRDYVHNEVKGKKKERAAGKQASWPPLLGGSVSSTLRCTGRGVRACSWRGASTCADRRPTHEAWCPPQSCIEAEVAAGGADLAGRRRRAVEISVGLRAFSSPSLLVALRVALGGESLWSCQGCAIQHNGGCYSPFGKME